MKQITLGCILFIVGIIICILLSILGYVLGWFTETTKVAKEQFGPRTSLQKYEDFKNIAAILESKIASIEVFEAQIKAMEIDKTQRDERETLRQRQAEVVGMKSSYNQLAAKYNADMSKFNYSYANIGELPKGADKPLPREFKPYITH